MTADPALIVSLASTGTLTIALLAAAGLKAWQGWLEIKRLEAERGRRAAPRAPTSTRFELADLRERIRRLEAIANGSEG